MLKLLKAINTMYIVSKSIIRLLGTRYFSLYLDDRVLKMED